MNPPRGRKSAARVSTITLTLVQLVAYRDQLVACGLVFSKKADPRHENNPNPGPVGGFPASWWPTDGQLVAFLPVGGLRTRRVSGALNAVGRPFDLIEESPAPW